MTARPPRVDSRSHVVRRRADGAQASTGLHLGPLRVTPVRTVLAVAFVGALAFIGYAVLRVRDTSQIPMITAGAAVLGVVFTALSVGGAIRMWQAWQDGLQGRTILFAVACGIAGMIAIGCFAGALVLALVWGA